VINQVQFVQLNFRLDIRFGRITEHNLLRSDVTLQSSTICARVWFRHQCLTRGRLLLTGKHGSAVGKNACGNDQGKNYKCDGESLVHREFRLSTGSPWQVDKSVTTDTAVRFTGAIISVRCYQSICGANQESVTAVARPRIFLQDCMSGSRPFLHRRG